MGGGIKDGMLIQKQHPWQAESSYPFRGASSFHVALVEEGEAKRGAV